MGVYQSHSPFVVAVKNPAQGGVFSFLCGLLRFFYHAHVKSAGREHLFDLVGLFLRQVFCDGRDGAREDFLGFDFADALNLADEFDGALFFRLGRYTRKEDVVAEGVVVVALFLHEIGHRFFLRLR